MWKGGRQKKWVIFHDGRIGFLPTPSATVSLFIWLPFGLTLSILRHLICILLPFNLSIPLSALTGMLNIHISPSPTIFSLHSPPRLFICNHRTLLDPIYISAALKTPLTALVYSLSPFSEFLSPIKTARLTRNKLFDKPKFQFFLNNTNNNNHLVLCPEGTTCRENFLLRFSPLFAELADRVTPVALDTRVTMFYGNTVSGYKWLDSVFFLMNPRPMYSVRFVEDVLLVSDDGKRRDSVEVANFVQREIGRCLGFRCTMLTRKDKYQILAGNDGVV